MTPDQVEIYRCPVNGSELSLQTEAGRQFVASANGARYPVNDGIPDFVVGDSLADIEAATQAEYDRVADDIYDRALDWQFKAFLEDEETVRETMLDMIAVRPGMKVLEVGCGTGRDSWRLAKRLGAAGELHMQDLSSRMVHVCRRQMAGFRAQHDLECAEVYSVSNATALPYADETFDAVFHFGGFNHFGDLKAGAAELTRVTKIGGRVLYGDEAVAPWLKGTEFDGIVSTNNALFKADIPLTSLPASARDVTVKWVIANCFYVIAYTRGEEGAPPLDLDLPHSGVRGGSLRSRYFGVLEGVSVEAKARVRQAAAEAGLSIHDWLDKVVRDAAGGGRK